jgi:heme exporter protein D
MSDFFAMSGYAAFVWPAYGVSALGLGSATALVWLAYRRAVKRLASLEHGP